MKNLISVCIFFLITSCATTTIDPYEGINYLENKNIIDSVLKKYQGEILTPKDVKNINLNNLSKGYAYKLIEFIEGNSKEIETTYYRKFNFSKNNNFYFSSVATDEKYGPAYSSFKVNDNKEYFYYKGKYLTAGETACFFELGACRYDNLFGDSSTKVTNVFDNGLWVTSYKTDLGVSVRKVRIFDKNGFLLFSLHLGSLAKKAQIKIRDELSPTDIAFIKKMRAGEVKS